MGGRLRSRLFSIFFFIHKIHWWLHVISSRSGISMFENPPPRPTPISFQVCSDSLKRKIWEKLFTRFLFSLCICVQFQQALSGPWRRWSVLRFNADVRAGAGLSLSQKFPLSKSRRFWYLSLHKICLIILGVGPRVELQLLGWDCQIWIWSISEFRYKIEKYNFICPFIISLI